MPVFEFTFVYPDLSYDEHRRFLASVAANPPNGLDGFRRHGQGLALTFVIQGEHSQEQASAFARQLAGGCLPRSVPAVTLIDVLPS